MRAPKSEIFPLVADMHALGYSASDMSKALLISAQRIGRILRDMGISRPKLDDDGLPVDQHMLERVVSFRNLYPSKT
ncbi:MAG: hypothetical protein ACRENK_15700 [Gemmatimonadaceae bacterium]